MRFPPALRRTICLLPLFLAAVSLLGARPMELEDLFRLHRVSDPQISPDGSQVAFVVTDPVKADNYNNSDLWLVSTVGGAARQLTNSDRQDRHPRWSPDGEWLAFESNRGGDYQLWVMPAAGGEARQLTTIATEGSQPVWSPDGKQIAFVSAVFPEFSARPFAESDRLNRERQQAHDRGRVKARVIDHLLYRHLDSWEEGRRLHLFVLPVKNGGSDGEPRDVTPGDDDAVPTSPTFAEGDEFEFSPDGRTLVFTAPPMPVRAQAWSTNHDLWSVDLATGEKRPLTTNPAADCTPHFSPDGKMLAYRAQTRPGDEADRWQLMLLDLASGGRRSLTEKLDRSVEAFRWSPDGTQLYFHTPDQGGTTLWSVDLHGAAVRVLAGGTNAEASVAAGGALVYTHAQFNEPPEVMLWRPAHGGPLALTHLNDAWLKDVNLTPPESVMVAGAGGTSVQMWIVKPPGFDPAKQYPLVFWVHGGPEGVWDNAWSTTWNPELWAAQGYVVALPNPRGSLGFGQQFTDEAARDWNGRVQDDLAACLAWLEKQPYVDPTRMAAAGGSFGGYVMNWFEGHTDKFRCLVNHDGIYNLDSLRGTTDEQWFADWEFGRPGETTAMAPAASPHLYAASFRTPMLVIHGEQDFRVPSDEGLQVFTALQRRGVPSRLLLFPDAGHWVLKPADSERWHQTVFAWLAEYLKK